MFKIYFDNRVINVGNTRSFSDSSSHEDVHYYSKGNNIAPIFSRFVASPDIKETFIVLNDEDALWRDIFQNLKYKEAAGGVVYNEQNEILLIKRFGKWDFPKGGIKQSENSRNAAMREVEEETAISDLKIKDILPLTFHLYILNENLYLKKTYWYGMKTTSTAAPIPQSEEDIEEAIWVKKSDIQKYRKNSWDSLFDVWNSIS